MPTTTFTPKPRAEPIPHSEFTALASFLTTKGLAATAINGAIGTAFVAQTRQQIADKIRTALRTLPRG
jgi:hypothetical protein